MPRLQRPRYLTCFYCGRKTSTQYTSGIRHFDCPNCDATNYLDENGEITDPPVATDKEATPAKYALPRAVSPPTSSPQSSAFCATCLKNQHLLRSVLAQYLPDPEDPDYAERERGYYRFRKHQEKLYPQICADCEPRVRARLEQAAYTAKTDVLRRMIDRSTTTGKVVKQTVTLDRFNLLGGWLRTVSLILQLLWHIVTMLSLFSDYFALLGVDAELPTFKAVMFCQSLAAYLPTPDTLIKWSFVTAILSCWWNPQFVQIFRGFTKHISGVSKWYSFQFMGVILRGLMFKSSHIFTPDVALLDKQASGHLAILAFTTLISVLGTRSIKIDMTPLFATSPRLHSFEDAPLESSPSSSSQKGSLVSPDETKSMAELLDEISRSPPRSVSPPSPSEGDHFIPRPFGGGANRSFQQRQQAMVLRHDDDEDMLPLNSLQLSNRPPAPVVQYEQEMDWSPTQSKYRAFNTYGQRQTQGFNQAPPAEPKGAFWYRVPPAPTTPAQRVFNPPNRPRLRQSPAEKEGARGGYANGALQGSENQQPEKRRPVTFQEPTFFPPPPKDDPRDPLVNMFGKTLALREDQAQQQQTLGKKSWLTRTFFGKGDEGDKAESAGKSSTAMVKKKN
ncbi:Ima1 N-terminal domain containing protein [Naviculisporaceae sp. PSN 640]